MATKTNFYLDNNLINPPHNWPEMMLELNYDQDRFPGTNQVTITDWEFVRENTDTILSYIEAGNIFEGIPFRIEIERGGVIEKPFTGYIDNIDGATFSVIRSNVKAKSHLSLDWLNDVADSFTYEYLVSTGEVTSDDYVFMPYVLNSVPDYMQSAIATFSVYVLYGEIKKSLLEIQYTLTNLGNPFTAANAILQAIFQIAYLVVLLAAIVKLVLDIIRFIIQPVKYHAGMYAVDLLTIGAAHLGLTFKSEIFNTAPFDKMVIIPRKFMNAPSTVDSQILGFFSPNRLEQNGYYKGTFGDLLRAMKKQFNAKLSISAAGELFLMRVDKNAASPQFKLPDIYNPQFSTNADELKSNYVIAFQTDVTDKNTIQQYQGTSYQVITQPATFKDRQMVLMKGLEQIDIPFALAKRKTELTVPETIIKGFLDVFDFIVNGLIAGINGLITAANAITKVLNKIIKALKVVGIKVNWQIKTIPKLNKVNMSSVIENRIGMMMIESDMFTVDKCLILLPGSADKFNKIHSSNGTYLSAKYLWDNFYFVNSFVVSAGFPTASQYKIKHFEKVPFVFADYQKVKANNRIYDASGGVAFVQSLKWNPFDQVADMVVRFPYLYAPNLIETKSEPDGR